MSKIDTIRELHYYKKMYHIMQDAVVECAENCEDPIVKEKLIKVQKEAEDIHSGEEYENRKYTTADELIIILLLSFIREREGSRDIDLIDVDILRDAVDWLLTLKHKKVELTQEEIQERIDRIFHPEKFLMDSEQ